MKIFAIFRITENEKNNITAYIYEGKATTLIQKFFLSQYDRIDTTHLTFV